MSPQEWLTCDEPDLMLEVIEGQVPRERLVEFVRRCWGRVAAHHPPVPPGHTAADEFAALADKHSDHDAALYASEAALKAAGWAPHGIREEQRWQAALLRQIVGNPFSP